MIITVLCLSILIKSHYFILTSISYTKLLLLPLQFLHAYNIFIVITPLFFFFAIFLTIMGEENCHLNTLTVKNVTPTLCFDSNHRALWDMASLLSSYAFFFYIYICTWIQCHCTHTL